MKILVLCSDGPHNKYLLAQLQKECYQIKVYVESGKEQLRWKKKNKKYKQYYALKYQMIRRRIMGSDKIRKQFFQKYIGNFEFDYKQTVFVENINEQIVEDGIRSYQPDIVIVMGTTILKKNILNAIKTEYIINIHGGFLPYYKGNHCFFFAYYNKEYDKIGSTLHFVNSGIDSGDIIERVVPDFDLNDNPEKLYCKAEMKAVDRLIELLKDYEQGKMFPRFKQSDIGKLYYTKDRKLVYDIKLFFRELKEGMFNTYEK